MLLGGSLATPVLAQVNVNVNIGQPAPVVLHAAPTMVFLPEPGIYMAVGVPYDIFLINGRYYYFHGNNWFWGPGHGGPWTHAGFNTLPPGLRKFKVVQLREFGDREYKVYKAKNNNGNGNGKGNGNKGKNR